MRLVRLEIQASQQYIFYDVDNLELKKNTSVEHATSPFELCRARHSVPCYLWRIHTTHRQFTASI